MIIKSTFEPAWWLRGPHLQTLGATYLTRSPRVSLQRERIELPDGDFVDIDWALPEQPFANSAPIVIVLHGIGGSIHSHYAKPTLAAITEQGWRGAFMYFRGCSGSPNRLPRSYHSGDTADLEYVVNFLHKREPNSPIAAIGYSLGGNVLLKWLGESSTNNPLRAAVAISVPFVLHKAANRLLLGLSRVYQWQLLRELRSHLRDKFRELKSPIDLNSLDSWHNFWEFDNHVTAPLHGFKDAEDYYNRASSRQYLQSIQVPTLIIHALNDPFMTPDVVPTEQELSEKVTLELSEDGGHVGFVTGSIPFNPTKWLENRSIEHLSAELNSALKSFY